MNIKQIEELFHLHKEKDLFGRYITHNHIEPLLKKLENFATINHIGTSVLEKPIYSIQVGNGNNRILMWSQMHGNESTTTKAVFDLINTLCPEKEPFSSILESCTLLIIPILNPDGAEVYTRLNANQMDLNRDAQDLTQPESRILQQVFRDFKPNFCFNLHGQRTIFSAGRAAFPATVSFLAPAEDEACTVTPTRRVAMELIGVMNKSLQALIPNQIGVYDDAFNINCVGDTFQSLGVPTVLFEAGHCKRDYYREDTRFFIYLSLLNAINYISNHEVTGQFSEPYHLIPENEKKYYDIIIRNASFPTTLKSGTIDIGILYQEVLNEDQILFKPKVEIVDDLTEFYGHREIHADGKTVFTEDGLPISVGHENDFVILNNYYVELKSQMK